MYLSQIISILSCLLIICNFSSPVVSVPLFECNRITGITTTDPTVPSIASCPSTQILTSCGISGTKDLWGTYIDPLNSNDCIANTESLLSPVTAVAVCCSFPEGAIKSITTVESIYQQNLKITTECPSNSILTGCQINRQSGNINQLRGTYSTTKETNPLAIAAWIKSIGITGNTHKQCIAQTKESGTNIRGGAQCIELNEGYELDCVVSRKDAECPADYQLVSCMAWTSYSELDGWYYTEDGNCYIGEDNDNHVYQNGICCRLSQGDSDIFIDAKDNGSRRRLQVCDPACEFPAQCVADDDGSPVCSCDDVDLPLGDGATSCDFTGVCCRDVGTILGLDCQCRTSGCDSTCPPPTFTPGQEGGACDALLGSMITADCCCGTIGTPECNGISVVPGADTCPTTASPTTATPTTAAPTTSDPTTASPTTASPTTSDPTTADPTTATPTTATPTTAAPTTSDPTTADPTTASPTTAAPTTSDPTTASPTTSAPTTSDPTTADPTTASPTTANPTTATPTTANPTTADPTTSNPTVVGIGADVTTTSSPTTAEPTTSDPTTANPTTASPTTASPTTAAPVTPIGLDLGSTTLVPESTMVGADEADPTDPMVSVDVVEEDPCPETLNGVSSSSSSESSSSSSSSSSSGGRVRCPPGVGSGSSSSSSSDESGEEISDALFFREHNDNIGFMEGIDGISNDKQEYELDIRLSPMTWSVVWGFVFCLMIVSFTTCNHINNGKKEPIENKICKDIESV